MSDIAPVDKGEGWSQIPVEPPSTIAFLQKKVLIAMPWFKQANPATAFAVMCLSDRRRTASVLNYGDAYIAHSRNSIADAFLGTDLDWLLSIDDDMLPPFGNSKWYNLHTGFDLSEKFAGLNAIDRLLSHGKTIVGGLYFSRHKKGVGVFNESRHPDMDRRIRNAPVDEIIPTRWCGTGCLLVHRSVFLDIEKKFPRLARGPDGKGGQWYSSSEHELLDAVDRARAFLSKGPMTGEKALHAYTLLEAASAEARRNSNITNGEDVTLGIRAASAGHQSFVDLGLVCGHLGTTCFGPRNTSLI